MSADRQLEVAPPTSGCRLIDIWNPVESSLPAFFGRSWFFDAKMDRVNVRFSQPPALDCYQSAFAEFTDEFGHARAAHPHVRRQFLLARKTGVIVPGVA